MFTTPDRIGRMVDPSRKQQNIWMTNWMHAVFSIIYLTKVIDRRASILNSGQHLEIHNIFCTQGIFKNEDQSTL